MIINIIIINISQINNSNSEFSESADSSDLQSLFRSDTLLNNETFYTEHWKSDNLDFFDSNLNDKNIIRIEDIIYIRNHLYYWDIHLFTAWMKNIICIKIKEAVYYNLITYLHSTALEWYTAELTDIEKELMLKVDITYEWIFSLIKHFQQWAIQVWFTIKWDSYTLRDIISSHFIYFYCQVIFQNTKSVSIMNTAAQLIIIYFNIYWKFHTQITELTSIIFI